LWKSYAYSSIKHRSDSSLAARLSEIYANLAEIEADKAPAKAGVILSGLGFTSEMQVSLDA